MHEVLVNRLGGLSLPRKSVVRLTDRPDMTLDVYRGRKTTMLPSIELCEFLLGFKVPPTGTSVSDGDLGFKSHQKDERSGICSITVSFRFVTVDFGVC